jgi:hypothetical protein
MEWQQFTSLIIVAFAAAALVWAKFRRRKFSFQRDTHCGCSGDRGSHGQGSVIFHARKGESPRVLIKMK